MFGTCSTPWPAKISVQERRWMPFCELKWSNDLEGQGQCLPFSIPAVRIPRYIFSANLVILAQIYDELSHREAKFPRILCQNDLEGQDQWPPFSIPAESMPWWTDRRTDRHRQRQYPFGLKGQGVITIDIMYPLHMMHVNNLAWLYLLFCRQYF